MSDIKRFQIIFEQYSGDFINRILVLFKKPFNFPYSYVIPVIYVSLFYLFKKTLHIDVKTVFLDDFLNGWRELILDRKELKEFPQNIRMTISALFLNQIYFLSWFYDSFLFVFASNLFPGIGFDFWFFDDLDLLHLLDFHNWILVDFCLLKFLLLEKYSWTMVFILCQNYV